MMNAKFWMSRHWQAAVLAGALVAGGVVNADPAPDPESGDRTITVTRMGGGSFLGVGVSEIDSERAKALNLREERGVEITRVEEDSPAAKGGVKAGDVVLEFNGQRVEGMEQFMRMVRETPPGREVKLTVSRNGGPQTLMVKTGSRKLFSAKSGDGRTFEFPNIVIPDIQLPDMPKAYMSWRSSMLGIEAESIDSQLAQFFGVKEGVLVRSVIKGSAAEKAGLKAGDVITRVDATNVSNPREVSSAIRAARSKKNATLTVVRERKEQSVAVALEDKEGDAAGAARPGTPKRAISVHTGPRYLVALED